MSILWKNTGNCFIQRENHAVARFSEAPQNTPCASKWIGWIDIVNSPLVSVIVPVFNEGRLLCQCLDSLTNQSLQNIEIVIVNDASTDDSQTYIEEYQSRDKRITVQKHDVNMGLGEARNTGVAAATGKYVFFLDSDDSIPLDAIETLSDVAEIHQSELVIGKARSRIDVDRNYVRCDLYNISIDNYPDLLYNHSAWNKLIKLEVLNDSGIRFVPPRYAEDILFSLKLNMYCRAITIITKVTYHYRWGRQVGSVTNEKISDAQNNVINAHQYVAGTGNDFLIEAMSRKTVRNIYGNMRRALNALDHDDLVKYLDNWNQVVAGIPSRCISDLPDPVLQFYKLITRGEFEEAIKHWKKSTNYGVITRLMETMRIVFSRIS